ncbi:uncharacterized protein LTR77_006280 [Saxophila tyrrhenica]|uniref:Zn(2)-C6 fungal-type domain-containing protein n=1 Tax=Saxophila tyrrhenica TaxID=1690608 RepID=A0AAV9P7P6_9PEZI|nr:hypothetical protein LTR77_006280 [Saxophila tyrrhenica]
MTAPRRYAKACDACHRKKIRCEVNGSSCTLCQKTGQDCTFTKIEKTSRKKPRRGDGLLALEDRLKDMEALLRRQNGIALETEAQPQAPQIPPTPSSSKQSHSPFDACALVSNDGPFNFEPKDRAIRLTQGTMAACNRAFPVWNATRVLKRMETDWPPDKRSDLVWWTNGLVVLCHAHRLRAMSEPSGAEADNREACRYLTEALTVAPSLPYGKPSLDAAQVLLAIATVMRGTPMAESARMFVSSAAHILQNLDAHMEESADSPHYSDRDDRARVFSIAYVLDKNFSLVSGKPPLFHEQDISRLPLSNANVEGFALIQSLDGLREVNFLVALHRLAAIQGQLWNRLQSATASPAPSALIAAQNEVNALLLSWRTSLPFSFKPKDLVGQWPKYCIISIVVLHFQYFQTLVAVNKKPALAEACTAPLYSNCPTATALKSYTFSTESFVVSAAREAFDLASLIPMGNFQHVWLYFEHSVSAVLTLLVNGIVRPLGEGLSEDFRRIDEWISVIDVLASTSERADLLRKKQFLLDMRTWMLSCVKDALAEKSAKDVAAQTQAPLDALDLPDTQWSDNPMRYDWAIDGSSLHPDNFPLDQLEWDWLDSSLIPT